MDSQCKLILAHLRLGLSVTPADAWRRWGCMRLAARINDLRKRGAQIEAIWERANGKRYARYFLKRQNRAVKPRPADREPEYVP